MKGTERPLTLWSNVLRRFLPRSRRRLLISADAAGIFFRRAFESPRIINWSHITEVFIIKLNTIAISDLLCVGVRFDTTGSYITSDELRPEFDSLMDALQAHLPIADKWRENILSMPASSKLVLYGHAFDGEYEML